MNTIAGRSAADSGADARTLWSNPLATRLAALPVLAMAAAILGVGAWLTPDPAGMGTHTELGLPACGVLAATGIPCATCGMTTAVSYAAHGQIFRAFYTQPAGALFALALAAAVILAGYSLVTGVSLAPLALAAWRPRYVLVAAAVVLGAWVYKIILVCGIH